MHAPEEIERLIELYNILLIPRTIRLCTLTYGKKKTFLKL
jgi:hypothetical protein